jgi:8-oxo-dGTP pyrophosphatase MutT (NUDIX family)
MDVAKHQGEISFPGGAAEKGDRNLIETALRETCEEIGISRTKINVLGTIDPVPTISNYCVLPVIGIIDWPVAMNLNKSEVEKIILMPVDWLKKDDNWYQQEYYYAEGKSRTLIHYKDYDGDHLWGLTAMLVQRALQLI